MLLRDQFLLQAQKAPEALAFCCGDAQLSYAELAHRAGQLATALAAVEVRAGDRVAILLPADLWQVVAIQACFYLGAAFVPVDPRSPDARIAAVLRQCEPCAVVADDRTTGALAQVAALVPATVGLTAPLPETPNRPFAEVLAMPATTPRGKSDLAYIMFTSGSTGVPKGIAHTHGSGYAYVERAIQTYGITASDRCANFAPLHFDIATLGYLAAPCSGAATTLLTEAEQLFPASTVLRVLSDQLTIWYSAPFALRQLLRRDHHLALTESALRWVLFGGEPFPPGQLKVLMETLPQARFSNVYGPAEVNQCTYYHLPGSPDPTTAIPWVALGVIRKRCCWIRPGWSSRALVVVNC